MLPSRLVAMKRFPFKARVLGSSPSRLTTSYCRQNLQNDLQALSACLVVLRTRFINVVPHLNCGQLA